MMMMIILIEIIIKNDDSISPSILLSSALCRSGFWTASRLRSSLAHTMNAFMGRLMRGSGALSTGVLCGPCPSGASPSPAGHSKDSGHDEYALMRAAMCARSPPRTRDAAPRSRQSWKFWGSEAWFIWTTAHAQMSAEEFGAQPEMFSSGVSSRWIVGSVFSSWKEEESALYLRSRFQEKPRRTPGSSLIASWAPWKERREREGGREREREGREGGAECRISTPAAP